jgi:GTP-binding protein
LIADVGLVGLPNAGKSTFLAAVTRAKPKIADYPFTTLHPQLGVVRIYDEEFVLADIPGLIENAHQGVGLGHRFLGHIERCRVLLHLIDGTQDDVGLAYQTIRNELKHYEIGLYEKDEILALNKCDALLPEEIDAKIAELTALSGKKVYILSAVAQTGVTEVLQSLLQIIHGLSEDDTSTGF